MKLRSYLLGLSIAALLAACGGGGGGSTPAAPVTPPVVTPPVVVVTPPVVSDPNLTVPLQAAFDNIRTKGLSGTFIVTGWDDSSAPSQALPPTSITGSGTYNMSAAVPSTYSGTAVLQATEVIQTTTNLPAATGTTTAQIIYNANSLLKAITVVGNKAKGTLAFSIPATVKTGSTGSLGTYKEIATIVSQTDSESFVVSSGNVNSLLVSVVNDTTGSFGNQQVKTTFRVNTNGDVNLVSIETRLYSLGSTYRFMTYTFEGTPPAVVLPPQRTPTTGTSTGGTISLNGFVVTQSSINGTFLGWRGNTVIVLANGQSWRQTDFLFTSEILVNPNVTVRNDAGQDKMTVDGSSATVNVTRVF